MTLVKILIGPWIKSNLNLLPLAESKTFQPRDKTNKMTVRPQIRPVWSESSLSAWRKLGSLATYWAHSEDSDQTGRMPRLIWVFAGRTVILLVLSWGGSFSEYSSMLLF